MEKPYCQLCGKYKPDEALKKVLINPPPPLTEKIEIEMCFNCDKILFNMNRILTEIVKARMERLRKVIEEKKIIVPGTIPSSYFQNRR